MAQAPTQTADAPLVEPAPRRKRQLDRKQQTDSKTRRQPPYAVLLHNDDRNSMWYVVGVLRKVFGYGRIKSLRLMMTAHRSGVAQVWSGALEVAELKADQIRSCGPDPAMVAHGAGTLRVSIEPLE